ncbi:MAG: tetratricopeptide repeat protein [Deltaproteobacteria bacterium]|nr:tetratricopeptide repeat protein [Deltaproteobacteria bacterium]
MFARLALILHIALSLSAAGAGRKAPPRAPVAPRRPDPISALAGVPVPHPFCNSPINLNVGRDYFAKILNDLPGREDYNSLVMSYIRSDWAQLDKDLDPFRKIYETSPLIEPVAFLSIQAAIERIRTPQDLNHVEKDFREVLLLYPKSEMLPVITAGMANHWLEAGKFERALSIYEKGRIQFEESPLACVFLMGSAEAQFQMNEFSSARTVLGKVVEKCMNRRIRTAALLRHLDVDLRERRSVEISRYEELLSSAPLVIEEHYPWLLHNIGERYFQAEQYKKSKFYFEDYLKQPLSSASCSASAQKRIADIALRQGERLEPVVEKYFKASDLDKEGRFAEFCYLHGLMLGYAGSPKAEKALRFQIFDKQIENIKHYDLQTIAYLEKGIAALEAGEPSALPYLIRFHEREKEATGLTLDTGVYPALIGKLIATLVKTARAAGGETLLELQRTIQPAYALWGTASGAPKETFAAVYEQAFQTLLRGKKIKEALQVAAEWRSSAFWAEGISEQSQADVARVLWGIIREPGNTSLKEDIWNKRNTLEIFTPENASLLWYSLADSQKDDAALGRWEATFRKAPKLLVAPSPIRGKAPDTRWELLRGMLNERLGHLKEADRIYSTISDPGLGAEILVHRFAIAQSLKDRTSLLKIGPNLITALPPVEKRSYLNSLCETLAGGKMWKEALALGAGSKAWGMVDADVGALSYLLGRAAYEIKDFGKAVENLQLAIEKDSNNPQVNEGFFKLGKSLAKTKNLERAREVWGGLVKRDDPFWSPLAANELSLLDRVPASKKP